MLPNRQTCDGYIFNGRRLFSHASKEVHAMTGQRGRGSAGNFAVDRERASRAGRIGGHKSSGNFANNRARAAEAGRNGGALSNGGGGASNNPGNFARRGGRPQGGKTITGETRRPPVGAAQPRRSHPEQAPPPFDHHRDAGQRVAPEQQQTSSKEDDSRNQALDDVGGEPSYDLREETWVAAAASDLCMARVRQAGRPRRNRETTAKFYGNGGREVSHGRTGRWHVGWHNPTLS